VLGKCFLFGHFCDTGWHCESLQPTGPWACSLEARGLHMVFIIRPNLLAASLIICAKFVDHLSPLVIAMIDCGVSSKYTCGHKFMSSVLFQLIAHSHVVSGGISGDDNECLPPKKTDAVISTISVSFISYNRKLHCR